MFMNDCVNQTVVREHVVDYLTAQGLPCRKKFKNDSLWRLFGETGRKNTKVEFKMKDGEGERLVRVYDRKVFGVTLRKLDMENVKLKTGEMVPVPPIVHDLCGFIMENVKVEGIFRKSGSTSRQADIKSKINGRLCLATEELDVIDVAAVIKYFLRQLPDPLIPTVYHKLFAACYDAKNSEELLLLAALLLPIENLNLLTYLMQFFMDVSNYSSDNKMTVYNLAVCIAPNIFQIMQFSAEEFSKYTGITRIFIERCYDIGKITEYVQHKINLKRGFNHVHDKPFTKMLTNVVKGLNFMTC